MPSQTIAEWLQGINGDGVSISWWSGRDNGIAWVNGWGSYCDTQVQNLKDAVKSRFPDYGATDALPHQAGDRNLILSQFELEANERARIKAAWETWANAGQPAELLAQLYWGGFGGAVLVQQNGLAYSLSAAPTAGVDPTSLLTVTTLGATIAPFTLAPYPQREPLTTSGTTASLTPAGAAATQLIQSKTIPASTPWWTFDSRTDLCNRFAVLFPTGAPAFMTYGVATFAGTDSATVVWNNPLRFTDTSYLTLVGMPVVTSGSPPMSVYEDSASRTKTGTVINAAGPWTGSALVISFPVGGDPFCNISDGDLSALRVLVKRWKPAATQCMGFYVLEQGRYWDWPIAHWDDAGLTWGAVDGVVDFTT